MSAVRSFALLVLLAIGGKASAQAEALRELFHPVLAQPGLGGLPVHAQVSVADDVVDCDIRAVVARPAGQVMALLGSARGWCEFLLLHPNVKACAGVGQRILMHVGTRHFQPVELSRPQRYDLRVERHEDGMMSARLRPVPEKPAEVSGPALIEVVALDEGRSGVRVRYREPLGAGGRRLATAGAPGALVRPHRAACAPAA